MNEKIKCFADAFWEKIKQKPYSGVTMIALVVLFLLPFLIWLSFYIGDQGYIMIETSLSVGDALSFYSSLIASMATIALGVIAVMQNTRLQKLELDTAAKNNSCSIYVEKSKSYQLISLSHDGEDPYTASNIRIQLTITNSSEPFLKKISIQFADITFSSHITLAQNESKNVRIFLPEGFQANTLPVCKIIFTSCYDVNTYGDFQITIKDDPHEAEIRYYHFYGTTNN